MRRPWIHQLIAALSGCSAPAELPAGHPASPTVAGPVGPERATSLDAPTPAAPTSRPASDPHAGHHHHGEPTSRPADGPVSRPSGGAQ